MPALSEFIAHFGFKDLVLTLIIAAIIVIAREERKIFRRRKNAAPDQGPQGPKHP